ncbi:MAG: FecR domain-containing protein [Planctomycetia bacterium]|nr:FecR domain-containing protein [Planctomycetia bacterium]
MSSNPYEHYQLVDAWVDGSLSAEEALILLNLLRTDAKAVELLRANVLVDFLLKESCRTANDLQALWEQQETKTKVQKEALASPDRQSAPAAAPELSWDELVRLQNLERPYHVAPEHWKPLPPGGYNHPIRFSLDDAEYSGGRWNLFSKFVPISKNWKKTTVALLAFFIPAFLLILIAFSVRQPAGEQDAVLPTDGVASITEMIDAVWEPDTQVYKRGQILDDSTLRLKSGTVQVTTDRGTELILEGPGELCVNDEMKAFCQAGKLNVRVAKSDIGYEVVTPHGRIIDRGTEFFIEAMQGKTKLAVSQGKVDYASSGGGVYSVFVNEAIVFDLYGKIKKLVASQVSQHYTSATFATSVKKRATEIQEERALRDEKLDVDPKLLARFFLGKKRSHIVNLSKNGQKNIPELTLAGNRWCEGELTTLDALDLSDETSFAEFTIPGRLQNMKLEVTVRMDKYGKSGNILLASRDFPNVPGSFIWQVSCDGRLQLHVATSGGHTVQFDSSPVLDRSLLKTWGRIAVSLDTRTRTVNHFYDGKLVHAAPLTDIGFLKPGDCAVGHFKGNKQYFNTRLLNGAVGEIKVWGNSQE